MKLFKYRNYISSKELSNILIFSSIIFLISLYNPLYNIENLSNLAINSGYQLSNFDILYSFNGCGLISKSNFMILIIPFFSILILCMVDYNNSIIIIRHKNKKRLWRKKIALILISSFLLSILLVIGGYVVSGLFVKGYSNTWNTKLGLPYLMYGNTEIWNHLSNSLVTYKVLLFFFITTFLGLCFWGIFVCTFQLFMRNVYVYLMILVIAIGESGNFFNLKLLEGIIITPSNWINISSIITNNICFLVGFVLLYFWGMYIYLEKDEGIEKKHWNVW